MRIAFVDWSGDPARPGASGLSDLVWAMAVKLAGLGDDVHIFGTYTVDPAPNGITVHRFAVPPIGYRNIVGHILIVLRALSYVRRWGPWDIVHAPEYLTTAIFSQIMPDIPVVLTVPGNIFERLDNINPFDPVTTGVYKWAARISARRCAAIIATSAEQQRWWHYSGAPISRIVQIPLGVDTQAFRYRPGTRAKLGADADQRLLFVGNLKSENGAEQVLQAFSLIRRKLLSTRLHMVGSGNDGLTLRTLATRLGIETDVQWHATVPFAELPDVYSAADVFVFPRLSRVTPRVIFEAMSCALPIVTSRIGGIMDFVVDRQTGLLTNPRDPAAIAECAVELLRDRELADAIRNQARRYAEDYLDWNVVVKRVRQDVYMPISDNRHCGLAQ